ncbi:MAG TPA: peptidylprolyl isomerase [Anaerolineae bacterium]|nr:peptidylprolyl isomerase [Anaerolineae bacterium]
MPDNPRTIADDVVVGLDYTLKLEDGRVVDSSAHGEPLEFLQGHGQIIPGLEKELYGMAVGDEKNVIVQPHEGYGERQGDAYQQFPRDAFPPDAGIEPGMAVQLVDQAGNPHMAFITEVNDDNVLLDLNHPLAGETLHFDVKIASLRQADEEELEHGHVH